MSKFYNDGNKNKVSKPFVFRKRYTMVFTYLHRGVERSIAFYFG